jgi:hypothetical protein
MPTGYTAAVQDGSVTFNQFVWRCARAMGALVMMREDPVDAPIEEFKPSDYYAKVVAKAEAEIARLEAMTPGELEELVGKERAKLTEDNARYVREKALARERYDAMLKQVEAWEPPTHDHCGLRDFMAQQLESSIEFDCGTPYQAPLPGNPKDWRDERIASLRASLSRLREDAAKEIERTNARNEWVRTLKASVPYERPGT